MSTDTHTIPLDVLPVSEGVKVRLRNGKQALIKVRDAEFLGGVIHGDERWTKWNHDGTVLTSPRFPGEDIMSPWVDEPQPGDVWRCAHGDEREVLAIRDGRCIYWNRTGTVSGSMSVADIAAGTKVGTFKLEGGE